VEGEWRLACLLYPGRLRSIYTPKAFLSPSGAAACSDVPARRRRFPPAHPLLLALPVSHAVPPCPALCAPLLAENMSDDPSPWLPSIPSAA